MIGHMIICDIKTVLNMYNTLEVLSVYESDDISMFDMNLKIFLP